MKITARWLKSKGSCTSYEENMRVEKEFNGDIFKIVKYLIREERFSDANWLITRYMNKKQCVRYAVYSARLILPIFENKYPDDNRPRKSIEAAENYIKNPCKKTKDICIKAADAAYSAYASADYASSDYAASDHTKILKNGLSILKTDGEI